MARLREEGAGKARPATKQRRGKGVIGQATRKLKKGFANTNAATRRQRQTLEKLIGK